MGKLQVDLHAGCRCTFFEYWQLKRKTKTMHDQDDDDEEQEKKEKGWKEWKGRLVRDGEGTKIQNINKWERKKSWLPRVRACARVNGHGYRGWESSPCGAAYHSPSCNAGVIQRAKNVPIFSVLFFHCISLFVCVCIYTYIYKYTSIR